jgi:hypothetical protein
MKNYYKILKQKYTDKEIAESFILPSDLTKKEQEKADKDLSEFLKNRKRLSSKITDNGYNPISFKKKYTYSFDCEDISSFTDDHSKDVLIDMLLFEFKLALQTSLFSGYGDSKNEIK